MLRKSLCSLVLAVVLSAGTTIALAPSADAATRVDYSATCNRTWVQSVRVAGYDRNVIVSMVPTSRARWLGRSNVGAIWSDIWSCVPYPSGLYGWQGDSMWQQLACHATWSANIGGGWTGGPTWDFESWRPSVSMSYALQVWRHSCNW